MIPKDEKEKIWGYIRHYGGRDAGYLNPSVGLEYLLRFWNTKKVYINKLFGGKLILEKHIDIECPESILFEDMEEAIYPDGQGIPFISEYFDWI